MTAASHGALLHRAVALAKVDAQCAARISPARRSLGEGGCSMRITEDVRRYAAKQRVSEDAAIEKGLQEKAVEFAATGGDIYTKAWCAFP